MRRASTVQLGSAVGVVAPDGPVSSGNGHARWVRACHWLVAASVLTLAVSGFVILMAHPRLYWGPVGNDLTPALLELPISRNHRHGGFEAGVPFSREPGSPVSAVRTYDIFNQNSWGRSLHFLAGWFFVLGGLVYLVAGIVTGHLRRNLVPSAKELAPRRVARDLIEHLHLKIEPAKGGPPYGTLQKLAYCCVVLIALPMMIVTGMTMSPAITAGYPVLLDLFGGSQSARTIHFFLFAALVVFLAGHLLMVVLSGFGRQLRAMTIGS